MDVFKYRDSIIDNYRSFSTSFTKIRVNDIKEFVNKAYDSGHYWPDPLIQQSPSFVIGQTVEELVKNNKLHDKCKETFRFGRDGEHPGITQASRRGSCYCTEKRKLCAYHRDGFR